MIYNVFFPKRSTPLSMLMLNKKSPSLFCGRNTHGPFWCFVKDLSLFFAPLGSHLAIITCCSCNQHHIIHWVQRCEHALLHLMYEEGGEKIQKSFLDLPASAQRLWVWTWRRYYWWRPSSSGDADAANDRLCQYDRCLACFLPPRLRLEFLV